MTAATSRRAVIKALSFYGYDFMHLKVFFTLLSFGLIASCTTVDFSKRVVQQGTLISSKRVNQLKTGMSKQEAASIMGTSLLSPMFNKDRWDYAYTYRRGNEQDIKRHLVLNFQNGRLSNIEHQH